MGGTVKNRERERPHLSLTFRSLMASIAMARLIVAVRPMLSLLEPRRRTASPPARGMRRQRPSGAVVSAAFWLCLLSAAAFYALVVLSPKAVRWSQRADEYARLQQRLLHLREEIDRGERLIREWDANPALAPPGVSPAKPGDKTTSIVVEETLRFRGVPDRQDAPHDSVSVHASVRVLQFVAGSRIAQMLALITSAALLILAFTVFMDRQTTVVKRTDLR
ncbi:MAG: hypothetical protein KF861_13870 [Planctomycetaceae bacterium]|nr:hypothetical protein [Planctomycetaceae bacterium]